MKTQKKKKPSLESSSSQTSIGDLPEAILLRILSFLPTTTAAQTSAVAPAWRNLWHSVPVLNFDMQDFHRSKASFSRSEARQQFAEMLSQALSQRLPQFPVQKFRLSFPCQNRDPIRAYVDSWLSFMIGAEAVELDLDFSRGNDYRFLDSEKLNNEDLDEEELNEEDDEDLNYEDSDDEELNYEDLDDEEQNEEDLNYKSSDDVLSPYVLHCTDIANSSVKVLKLTCCDLCCPPSHELSPVKIFLLRELHLEDFSYKNEQIAHWLAACVNLESLSLGGVEINEDLKIESKMLKHFEFRGFNDLKRLENSVEICAPNLESFILHDVYDAKYYLKETSSLVAAVVKFPGRSWRDFARWTNLVSSLGSVERFTTQNMWCRSMFDSANERRPPGLKYKNLEKYHVMEEIFSETFVFHNLKHVELLTGYSEDDIWGLETLLAKCPQLETMALVKKYNHFRVKDMSIVLHMPRLRLVEMKKFQKTMSEMFVVRLLKKHGRVLKTIVAYPEKVCPSLLGRCLRIIQYGQKSYLAGP